MKVKLDAGAFMPQRAHEQDAGYDLMTPVCVTVPAGGFVTVDTGVHIELPPGKCAVVISKSGLYLKDKISSTGLIDEGFTGTIIIGLFNHDTADHTFTRGDKISQFFITDYYAEKLELVEKLSDTERGNAGYGSTGK
jgi:dUTP pyrophosphatase